MFCICFAKGKELNIPTFLNMLEEDHYDKPCQEIPALVWINLYPEQMLGTGKPIEENQNTK